MRQLRIDFKVPARKRVPLPGGDGRNFTTVPDGFHVFDLLIEVDVEKLVQAVGSRALYTKKHTTQLQSGSVKITAQNIRHVKVPT